MRQPLQIPSPDLERVRLGDPNATADAILDIYRTQNQLATLIANRIGLWQDVPYDAGLFSTNSTGGWTVGSDDVENFSFLRIDDLLILDVALIHTTINNGTTTELRITPPSGFKLKGSHGTRSGSTVWNNNTVGETGAFFVQSAGSFISMQRADGGVLGAGFPFTGIPNDFFIGFVGVFQILPVAGN